MNEMISAVTPVDRSRSGSGLGMCRQNESGTIWRTEDHEALLRAMRAADELTFALVARARGDASETCLNSRERNDVHGIRSKTEPVGADVHAGGD